MKETLLRKISRKKCTSRSRETDRRLGFQRVHSRELAGLSDGEQPRNLRCIARWGSQNVNSLRN